MQVALELEKEVAVTADRSSLDRLLSPRSVAIVGVSERPGSLGRIALENLLRFEFKGDIHLVNPTKPEILGRPVVPSIMDMPMGVDCVVMAVPNSAILASVKACAERGVGGIVIFSAGFAEAGPEGAAVQAEITAVAKAAGIAILGPNCLGFINFVDGVPMAFSMAEPCPVKENAVAVVSQSGAMSALVRAALHSRGISISLGLSTGNEAVCGVEDFLEHTLNAGRAKVICMVVEHFRDPKRFLRLAEEARRKGVPIVLLHPGRSSAARVSAQTHTGAMVGDYELMRTPVERRGVILVETIEEVIDLTELASRCPKRPHDGIAVLGESGAYKALTLDYCEDIGLTLPEPVGASAEALEALAPGLIHASNPVDLTAQGLVDPTIYDRAAQALMADGRCGSILITLMVTAPQVADRKLPPLLETLPQWAQKWTTVFAMLGEDTPVAQTLIDQIRDAGVPFFRSPERALRAVSRYTAWSQVAVQDHDAAATAPAERLKPGTVPEHAAKDLLQASGLPMPPRRLARTLEDAQAAARELGYPLVMKVQSPQASHKSDIGGVLLGIADDEQLKDRWARMQAVIADKLPGADVHGVLIERMSQQGVELILGARNDEHWGALVSVGFGGVEAEVAKDVVHLAPDMTADEIIAKLKTLKRAALFGPFRGREPRDLAAVAVAVQAVGRFMLTHPEVSELDINPLTVLAEGKGAIALDALMVAT